MSKYELTLEAYNKRVAKLVRAQKDAMRNVHQLHVKLQRGNRKTGQNCWTVSFLPVVDCNNCKKCGTNCYDLKADCIYPAVIADRAKNSAIHKAEPDRFWAEVDAEVKANFVRELRINVGGDLNDDDFAYVAKLGRQNPRTMILFFTKNYKGINEFLDHHRFPKNVRPIMSTWPGLKMQNKHNLPQSHLLYEDGTTTGPEWSFYCGGNCSRCAFEENGCWNLKRGEHVLFRVH